MISPISVEIEYPSLVNEKQNKKTARILGETFMGGHSELKSIFQYACHYFNFKKFGEEKSANVFLGILLCEMNHMEILGELLLKLGANPVYYLPIPLFNDFLLRQVNFNKTKRKMVLEMISAEMVSIERYKKIVNNVSSDITRAVIERIILDEELHVKVLKELLVG